MELDPEIVKLFQNLLVSADATAPENAISKTKIEHASYTTIPKFFYAPTTPTATDKLRYHLRREAHSLYLQKRSQELMSNDDLNALWRVLEENATTTEHGQQLISYDDFINIQHQVAGQIANCRKYLTARIYAQLTSRCQFDGHLEIATLYNYVMRCVFMLQCRIGLSFYDGAGRGCLTDADMEQYITDLIPTLTQVHAMLEPAFQPYYVCTVARRFSFFLDPLHTGRMRIRDILASGMIHELLELREEPQQQAQKQQQQQQQQQQQPQQPMSEETLKNFDPNANWFAMSSVLAVYEYYLSLDLNRDGMLSPMELTGYGTGTLTTIFIERVFIVCRTFDGEMDYKSFVDFVLAMENRCEPQALSFFFRILDVQHVGYLTADTLFYFFKSLQAQIVDSDDLELVIFEDFKNEIFDMIKPKIPWRITLHDLLASNRAATVVSILIEFQKFWSYETAGDHVVN